MHRVAIVGSGIAGMAAAREVQRRAPRTHVTLLEAGDHFGGHAHTVDVTLNGVRHGVDTGFLVYNERTYPHLVELFKDLAVAVAPADMSFSVQVPGPNGVNALEWSGHSLDTVFAQRRNLLRPGFWQMLADIVRFNKLATALARKGTEATLAQTLGDFLAAHRFSTSFRDHYLLPMVGCIWSCPTDQMLQFPVATLIRFCHNHGLIQVTNRPQWYTVRGGSRQYVTKLVSQLNDARLRCPVQALRRDAHGVTLYTADGALQFDAVILACHADQALQLLEADATADERGVLGAIRYQPNTAVLHTDASVLPQRPKAWAAWNYERGTLPSSAGETVCLHYLINRLQPLPWQTPVVVSLNPLRPIDERQVIQRIQYAHPVFDLDAMRAQARVPALQGQRRTWFCGAWCGHGFHEDGLKAGLTAARSLVDALPRLTSAEMRVVA